MAVATRALEQDRRNAGGRGRKPPPHKIRGSHGCRFDRDSLEFSRVANLADAVFAIALTLLVLGIEIEPVSTDQLADALVAVLPNLFAFLLGFALVANIWWQHHKLYSRLAYLDRGLVALTLALLGVVALVPFPTGLLGSHLASRAAVIPFIVVFAVLTGVFIALVWQAQRVGAWRRPLSSETYKWVLSGFWVTIAIMLLAAVIALAWPVPALATLALSNAPERILARHAPMDYDEWA